MFNIYFKRLYIFVYQRQTLFDFCFPNLNSQFYISLRLNCHGSLFSGMADTSSNIFTISNYVSPCSSQTDESSLNNFCEIIQLKSLIQLNNPVSPDNESGSTSQIRLKRPHSSLGIIPSKSVFQSSKSYIHPSKSDKNSSKSDIHPSKSCIHPSKSDIHPSVPVTAPSTSNIRKSACFSDKTDSFLDVVEYVEDPRIILNYPASTTLPTSLDLASFSFSVHNENKFSSNVIKKALNRKEKKHLYTVSNSARNSKVVPQHENPRTRTEKNVATYLESENVPGCSLEDPKKAIGDHSESDPEDLEYVECL